MASREYWASRSGEGVGRIAIHEDEDDMEKLWI